MFDVITTEFVVITGLLGVSALVFMASLIMFMTPYKEKRTIDLDAAIRDAPYHLLRENAQATKRAS